MYYDRPDLARRSGWISVARIGHGGASAPFGLPISDGIWSLEAEPETNLVLYPGELGGIKCWPASMTLVLAAGDRNTIKLTSEPFLRVIDSETRREIERVSVMEYRAHVMDLTKGTLPHVGEFGIVALSSPFDTPIPLSAIERFGACLLTADGYTWGVACCGKEPASQIVALDPAGALKLRVSSGAELLPPHCALRLFDASVEGSSRALYSIPFSEVRSEYVLPKVREGRYRVEIVRNAGDASELSLFSEITTINRGVESGLDVRLDDDPIPDLTEVFFLITGEDATLDKVEAMSIVPKKIVALETKGRSWLRSENVASRRPGLIEYEPLRLNPGTYLVNLRPLGYVTSVTIPVDVLHMAEVALPPVAQYTLSVTDSFGNHIVFEFLQVASSDMPLESLNRLAPVGASFLDVTSPVSFASVRGNLKVSFSAAAFGARTLVLDGSTQSRFDFSVQRASEIRLRLTQGGEVFSAPTSWWTQIRGVDAANTQVRCGLEFESTNEYGWYSEALLRPQVAGSIVVTFPRLLDAKGQMEVPIDVEPGRSTLVLDVVSGALMK